MGLSRGRTIRCLSGAYIAFQRRSCASISHGKFSLEIFPFLSKLCFLEIAPWCNWQHVWLWIRRVQVRALAGQRYNEKLKTQNEKCGLITFFIFNFAFFIVPALSSNGLGRSPLKAEIRVRFPLGLRNIVDCWLEKTCANNLQFSIYNLQC